MCSAITALIQWTKPCVGFWLCTPPTGIAPVADGIVAVDVVVPDTVSNLVDDCSSEFPGTVDVGLAIILLLLLPLLVLVASGLFIFDWVGFNVDKILESALFHVNGAIEAF